MVGKEVGGRLGLRGYEEVPGWVGEGEEPERGVRGGSGSGSVEAGGGGGKTAGAELDRAVREHGGPGSRVRTGVSGPANGKGGNLKDKSLDDWLAEEEEGGEEESEEEESEEESEEEGSTEEESEEDVEEGSEEESSEEERETEKLMG